MKFQKRARREVPEVMVHTWWGGIQRASLQEGGCSKEKSEDDAVDDDENEEGEGEDTEEKVNNEVYEVEG